MVHLGNACDIDDGYTTDLLCQNSYLEIPTPDPHQRADGMPRPRPTSREHGTAHTCNYMSTLNGADPIAILVFFHDQADGDTTALLCLKSHLEIPMFEPHRRADGMPSPGTRHRTYMQLIVHP